MSSELKTKDEQQAGRRRLDQLVGAITDPRTGTYLDKETMRYVCVAVRDGKPVVIGGYDARLCQQAKDASEREIWGKLLCPNPTALTVPNETAKKG